MPSKTFYLKEFQRKWNICLGKRIVQTKKRPDAAQETYKDNYNRRLRRQSGKLEIGDFMYLRVEREVPNQHLHKLAAVAERPQQVPDVDSHTVVIEKSDHSVERMAQSRVVLAPHPITIQKVHKTFRELTDAEHDTRNVTLGTQQWRT